MNGFNPNLVTFVLCTDKKKIYIAESQREGWEKAAKADLRRGIRPLLSLRLATRESAWDNIERQLPVWRDAVLMNKAVLLYTAPPHGGIY